MTWSKSIVEWAEGQTAYISVPFTWLLPKAFMRCVWLREQRYQVRAGGPAVSLMPEILKGVADIGGDVPALSRHNPNATFTTRGCIRQCRFCAVPKIEGAFRELADWPVKPIVCDNNILASSRVHFDRVIDSLKGIHGVDFNQGLDARLLRPSHIARLTELNLAFVRLAWDHIQDEGRLKQVIDALLLAGIPRSKIRCYVLVGYNDTPDDALYRCQTLKSWGISKPNVQRYQPLNCLRKNSYVSSAWTARELARFCRYWNRQNYVSAIPYEDFRG